MRRQLVHLIGQQPLRVPSVLACLAQCCWRDQHVRPVIALDSGQLSGGFVGLRQLEHALLHLVLSLEAPKVRTGALTELPLLRS